MVERCMKMLKNVESAAEFLKKISLKINKFATLAKRKVNDMSKKKGSLIVGSIGAIIWIVAILVIAYTVEPHDYNVEAKTNQPLVISKKFVSDNRYYGGDTLYINNNPIQCQMKLANFISDSISTREQLISINFDNGVAYLLYIPDPSMAFAF